MLIQERFHLHVTVYNFLLYSDYPHRPFYHEINNKLIHLCLPEHRARLKGIVDQFMHLLNLLFQPAKGLGRVCVCLQGD